MSGKHDKDRRCDSVKRLASHPVSCIKKAVTEVVGVSAGCRWSVQLKVILGFGFILNLWFLT